MQHKIKKYLRPDVHKNRLLAENGVTISWMMVILCRIVDILSGHCASHREMTPFIARLLEMT